MSNYEPKDGSGALFKNDKKEKDTHPDYKGSILINGIDYWLSSWIKEGKSGKFMGLQAQPKNKNAAPRSAPKHVAQADDLEDLPF